MRLVREIGPSCILGIHLTEHLRSGGSCHSEKNFTVTVTYLSSGFGYIDEDVLFTCGVFPRGYRPCRGNSFKFSCATALFSVSCHNYYPRQCVNVNEGGTSIFN